MATLSFEHPRVVKTRHGSSGWYGVVDLDDWGAGHWRPRLGAGIATDDPDQFARDAELLTKVLDRGPALGQMLVEGLWQEITRGSDNYWWTGDLDQVNKSLEHSDIPPLREAGDLYRVLDPSDILIEIDTHGDQYPVAWCNFGCDFEEEHGLSLLTDGDQLVGSGYAGDATKYERFSAVSKAEIRAHHEAFWHAMDNDIKPLPTPPWLAEPS